MYRILRIVRRIPKSATKDIPSRSVGGSLGRLFSSILGVLILASCSDVIGPTGGVIDVGFDPSPPSSLEVGATAQLHPVPLGENGRILEVVCITEFESSDPSVATISAEGVITGISAGSTLITVRLNTVPRTFTLTISAPGGPGNPDGPGDPGGPEDPDPGDPDSPEGPENPGDGPDDPEEGDDSSLRLSAGSVSFSATRGGPNPAPRVLQVTSSGGPVSGLSAEVQQGISWLSASLDATVTPAGLLVAADIAGLDVGSYLATITISGNDASPVILQVTLTITSDSGDPGDPGDPEDPDDPGDPETPSLLLSAGSASFAATRGGPNPAPQVVQVTSSGEPVSGLSVEIPDSMAWLGASLGGTTTPADLQLSADISGLETGTYVASLTISGTDATPATLQVTLTISDSGDPEDPVDPEGPETPALALSAGSASFAATQGGASPAPQVVEVTSSGGPVSGLTVEIPDSVTWLSGSLGETTTPAELQLSVDISGLDAGTYVASLTVSGNDATPAALEVTLTLEAPPAPALIGLELEVEANVLGGGDLLELNLTELLSDPVLDATVWALYSDGSKVDVTEAALLTTSDPLLVVDGPGVLNLAGVLVHSLLEPDHYLHAEYDGFVVEAGLRINLLGLGTLPLLGLELQEILPGAALGAGTELPYVLALLDDGIGGSVDLLIPGSHPDIEWSLVPRLLDCGALPLVDQLLCGTVANPLLSTILNLTDEVLEITDGVVTGLDLGILSPILGILGGVLNADLSAVVDGVVSDVVPVVIPLS